MTVANYAGGQAWLRDEYPQIASGFIPALKDADPALLDLGRDVYACLQRKCAADGRAITEALEALVHMSVDFLRLQPAFMKRGQYAAAGADDLFERFYGRREVMEGYYLDGLLLTYAFWRNHARLLRFFIDDFLGALAPAARLGEIGVGHGLMALFALRALPQAEYHGFDLSPFALSYTEALLGANSIAVGRARLRREDAMTGVPPATGLDAVWCGEVIEHVSDCRPVLHALRTSLAREGRAFVTTVANVEAEDHVLLFDSADHIRRVLQSAGFIVEKELILPVWDFAQVPLPINYAAILRPTESA
jgi:2-polyprenyl-3-methyl-5-hydroxy-6-metoxy-1,4-benzoquinol methylase